MMMSDDPEIRRAQQIRRFTDGYVALIVGLDDSDSPYLLERYFLGYDDPDLIYLDEFCFVEIKPPEGDQYFLRGTGSPVDRDFVIDFAMALEESPEKYKKSDGEPILSKFFYGQSV